MAFGVRPIRTFAGCPGRRARPFGSRRERPWPVQPTPSKDIDSVNLKDAYSVIKLAEGLLSVISNDRWQALSFAERYARYATLLSFKSREMANTAELLRLYVTETLESVEELKKEREEKIRLQRKKKLLYNLPYLTFDYETQDTHTKRGGKTFRQPSPHIRNTN